MAIDGMVGKCTECKSVQPDSHILKSGFGFDAPCKFCKGVIAAVPEQFANDPGVDRSMDRQRNLDHDPGDFVVE